MFDFLSAANPFNWLKTILIWFGILAVGLIIGGVGGCHYKQAQWDAEKVKQMEEAAKLEKEDRKSGAGTVAEFREGQEAAKEGSDFIKGALSAPKKPVLATVNNCQAAPQKQVVINESVKEDKTHVIEADPVQPVIILTRDFMQLYDVSVKPGDAQLRAGTYEAPAGTSLDEGFEKVIVKNNQQYAACRLQLNKLLDRIENKQKIFAND